MVLVVSVAYIFTGTRIMRDACIEIKSLILVSLKIDWPCSIKKKYFISENSRKFLSSKSWLSTERLINWDLIMPLRKGQQQRQRQRRLNDWGHKYRQKWWRQANHYFYQSFIQTDWDKDTHIHTHTHTHTTVRAYREWERERESMIR